MKMKVVAFNGSPRKGGNTEQAIETIFRELQAEGQNWKDRRLRARSRAVSAFHASAGLAA